MPAPVTVELVVWAFNVGEHDAAGHLLARMAPGARARARDALIRLAGEHIAGGSDLAACRFLLERMAVLNATFPGHLDAGFRPDGVLAIALLLNGRRVPSLGAVRRAVAGVAQKTF